jgi:hypothetical protein
MAVTALYVDGSAGSDTNSGSSEGSADFSGTVGITTGHNTYIELNEEVDLSGVSLGETIRVVGETGGIQGGEVFEITGVNDGTNVISINPETFDNLAGGLTWAIGGAFKTLQEAADNIQVSGSTNHPTHIKNSVTYTETMSLPNPFGGVNSYFLIQGYSNTPGDGGLVTIDGENTRANGLLTTTGVTVGLVVRNIRCTNHTGLGAGNTNSHYMIWRRCQFDNNGSGLKGGTGCRVIGCYAHDNTGIGINVTTNAEVAACVANDNGTDGIYISQGQSYKCVARGNASIGIHHAGGSGVQGAKACTVDGDGKTTTTGIALDGDEITTSAVDCIVYDCTTGISSSAGFVNRGMGWNNLLFNNTTDYSNATTHSGEVTTDPAFVDEANDDYTPGDSGGAVGAGLDVTGQSWDATYASGGSTIGALEAQGTDYPAVGDVESGVQYNNSGSTGTFGVPAVEDVRAGTTYGSGGTEFTGTFAGGGSGLAIQANLTG